MQILPDIKIRMQLRRLQQQRGEELMEKYVTPVVSNMVKAIRADVNGVWPKAGDHVVYDFEPHYNRSIWRVYVDNMEEEFNIVEHGARSHEIPQPPHVMPEYKLKTWMNEHEVPMDMYGYIQFYLHKDWWIVEHPGLPAHNFAQKELAAFRDRILDKASVAMQEMIQPVGEVTFGGY